MSRFAIRDAVESDFPFIYSTWLKGLRFGHDHGRYKLEKSESRSATPLYRKDEKTGEFYEVYIPGLFRKIDQNSYFEKYHKVLEKILAMPGTYISVACLNDDPATILGYAVCEDQIVHYVHVKEAFRGFGIAKSLCPQKIKKVTHITNAGWAILCEKFPNAVYDPFL